MQPDEKYTWLTEGLRDEFADFLPIGTKETKAGRGLDAEAIFKNYGGGVKTSRDDWAYDYNRDTLVAKMNRFIETYNSQVDKWKRRSNSAVSVDDFVTYDDTKIKWSLGLKLNLQRERAGEFAESKVRRSLYRPFCKRWLFFDHVLNEAQYQFPQFFSSPASETENVVMAVGGYGRKHFAVLASNSITDLNFYADPAQCFPFYTYNEDGSGRRENITGWALGQFRAQYGPEVGKWDIFHYVYALLHHPQYRQRYAENLKRELPRIPLVADGEAFAALVSAGARLKALHLGYEQAEPYPLRPIENPKASADELYRVTKMRLSPDKTALVVNDALTLAGIPAEAFQHRLGNRSALEWVIDQYQVSTDARSGITSDPNRDDEPEYIAQLARRVVSVSLETVQIVSALPPLPEPDPAIDPTPAGD